MARKTEPNPEAEGTSPAPRRRRRAAELAVPPPTDLVTTPQDEPEPAPEPPKKRTRRRVSAPLGDEAIPTEQPAEAEPDPHIEMPRTVFRSRAKKEQVPQETPADIAAIEAPVTKPARRGARKPKPAESVPSPIAEHPDEELPTFAWRTAGPLPTPEIEAPVPESPRDLASDLPAVKTRPVGKRTRRTPREDVDDAPDKTPAAEEPPQLIPEPPVSTPSPHRREPIFAPPGAPRVLLRNGVPCLVRGSRVYPSLFLHVGIGSAAEIERVEDELRMAQQNGVHLFSIRVQLEFGRDKGLAAAQTAADLTRRLVELDAEAQVLYKIVFEPPAGWDRKFPRARSAKPFGNPNRPSLCDDEIWNEALEALEAFSENILESCGESALGIHMDFHDWVQPAEAGYDTSPAAEAQFRNWLRHRYRENAVSLRAAWFDGSVDFETAAIPDYRQMRAADEIVRTDRKGRRWIDYHLFLSDATVQRLDVLAEAAKVVSGGRLLLGASYGYTFEWSYPASGHLSLGKLLVSPYFDFVVAPPSYRSREPGQIAGIPLPVDSCAINAKLFLSEEDYRTPISGRNDPDDPNPVMKTPQALESVHWRGAGAALAHGAGLVWSDSRGHGWLNSPGIWRRAGQVREALMRRSAAPLAAPDVALFIDERSLAYLVDPRAFGVLVQSVREAISRAGMSVGFYLLSDLAHREHFPESRLYVFVNAWDVRPEVRSAIKTRLQRDGKVLFWLYTAGLFEGGRESLERVREIAGIALKPQPFNSRTGTTLLNRRDPLCLALPEDELAEGGPLGQSYFSIPEEGNVLGEYTQTGLPSLVVRPFHGDGQSWTSVFLGEPIVTPALFRALGQLASAHTWSFSNDLVHVRPPFLTLHCAEAGQRTLTLPDKWSAYSCTTNDWVRVEGNCLRFNATEGTSYSFLVGMRSDLEAMLATAPSETLEADEMLTPPVNTVEWSSVLFDVPIMKLEQWGEEPWSEEEADELVLDPRLLLDVPDLEEPDSPRQDDSDDSSPKRRRRRRGRRDADAPREDRGERPSREDASGPGIHVMFRKRE